MKFEKLCSEFSKDFNMTTPLNEFISSVRLADTFEQEKFLISTEQALVRASVRRGESQYRPKNVMKLLFLEILGQNNPWGQMEVLTLMSEEQFSFKRIGYIAGSVLLDESADISVLVTQTLLKDLNNPNPNIQSLALAFIANCGTSEVCRDVATSVQKCIESSYPNVLKRAGMAILRIVKQNPDLAEAFKNSVQKLLNHTNHGVVLSGMNAVISLITVEPRLSKLWEQFAGPFTRILKALSTSRGTREFSYGVFNDPYMQIKAMKALALLKKSSDELDQVLQSIVSSTETRRNTGRAVLYQAVELVVAVSPTASLRGLAFNQVGRLLSLKDPNVLYSALSVFARVLYTERDIINRGSVDTQALQRYKKHIVRCLDHRDPSIRRRALDVISALIDETNVETLIPEIITFIRLADSDFRCELITKIYTAAVRFGPSKLWLFDIVHQILIDSGNYVSQEIITDFCDMILKNSDIQQHAVSQLLACMLQFSDNQTLVQVSAFVIGEFAVEDNGAIEGFKQIVSLPQTKNETKFYIITALGKLVTRLNRRQEAIELMQQLASSNNIEVQQRAGEMANILQMDNLCEEFLSPLQPSSTESSEEKHPQVAQVTAKPQEAVDQILLQVMDQPAKSNPPAVDLFGGSPAPSAPKANDLIGDLISASPVQTNNNISVQQQPAAVSGPTPPPQGASECWRTNDFIVYSQCQPNPENPNQVAVKLTVVSQAAKELSDFKLEYNVARGWKMMAKPLDGNRLMQISGKPLTQMLYFLKEIDLPFGLQARASFKYGSQPLTETATLKIIL